MIQQLAYSGRNKWTAVILCLLLGFMGIHHYYLRNYNRGIIYFLTCWTLIPGFISFFELIYLVTMPESRFKRIYNPDIVAETGTKDQLREYIKNLEKSAARTSSIRWEKKYVIRKGS